MITCSEVGLIILGLAACWSSSRGISRRCCTLVPTWTGSKLAVSVLLRDVRSVILYRLFRSLITHLASYFCQSCTSSQKKKAIVISEIISKFLSNYFHAYKHHSFTRRHRERHTTLFETHAAKLSTPSGMIKKGMKSKQHLTKRLSRDFSLERATRRTNLKNEQGC